MADTQNPVYTDGTTITGDGTEAHPLEAAGGGSGVSSLNALTGVLSLTSPDSSITITPSGSDIELTVADAAGQILKKIVTLTSAQLLALAVTPVQLIASPGAGKFINVLHIALNYTAGATPYTLGGAKAFNIEHGSPSGAEYQVTTAGLLDQATSQISPSNGLAVFDPAQAYIPVSDMDNQNLQANGSGSTITLGNGTLTFIMYYTIESAS